MRTPEGPPRRTLEVEMGTCETDGPMDRKKPSLHPRNDLNQGRTSIERALLLFKEELCSIFNLSMTKTEAVAKRNALAQEHSW